jgi:hypothetical protein
MKIAISYRRSDSTAIAGRVVDRLIAHYGPDSAFFDFDDIPYGADFRSYIRDSLTASDILLALVGPDWSGKSDGAVARIMEPDDPVRVEIEIALEHALPIIPVLIGSAHMPKRSELPPGIISFASLNAAPLDIGRDFHNHMERLLGTTDAMLAAKAGKSVSKPRVSRTKPYDSTWSRILLFDTKWILPTICSLLALTLPLAAETQSFAPPWPARIGAISSAIMVLIAAIAYEALKHSEPRRIARAIMFAVVLAGLGASFYFAGIARFTYKQPGFHGLWAKGYVCTADALLLFKDKCPDLGLDELSGAEFHEDRLWTSGSIAVVKCLLALLWLMTVGSVSVIIVGVLAKRTVEFSPTQNS